MDYEGVWGPSYMEEVGACVYVCVCVCVCVYVLGHNGGEPVALLQVAPLLPTDLCWELGGRKTLVGGGTLRQLQGRGPSQGLGVTHFHLLGDRACPASASWEGTCVSLYDFALIRKHGRNLK